MSDTKNQKELSNPAAEESFRDLLSQFEQSHSHKSQDSQQGINGTVVSITDDAVVIDIGYKSEGVLPVIALQGRELPRVGDTLLVNVKGRNPEGYYDLSLGKLSRPTDWTALEKAFAEKATIAGTVTGVVKGGLSVDIGVRAFMPASRTGTRDAAEMEKLVAQEIRCRITKLDVTEEDVVVDRRVVLEEQERETKERRYSELTEGDIVQGTVRSLADYGAFVDIGGVDGLLHIGDLSWTRVKSTSDVLSVGQQVEVRVLKIDPEKRRISLGMKQIQAHPWEGVAERIKVGERVRGTITRVEDYGAFVELEPGVEGLVHVSEMSWNKKVKASTIVKQGESVEAIVLGVDTGQRRISLGLKQALGDPWTDAAQRYAVGSVVEGTVTSLQKFGAFLQVAEGVEGMVHIGDITAEKRLNHPQEALKVGQVIRVQVLEVDTERRRLRLGMKQLLPTSVEEYIAEHNVGDVVTGRIAEITGSQARVELGEGVFGSCRIVDQTDTVESLPSVPQANLSSLTSMLQARWKGQTQSSTPQQQKTRLGQICDVRILRLDPVAKEVEVEIVR